MPDGESKTTDALRKQLKENSRLAAEAAIRAGVELHPRIAAIKASAHPTHAIASRIAEEAKKMGFEVRRSAASQLHRSAYVFCNGIKVRIADHPNNEMPDIDVHVDDPRAGSVSWETAVEWLRGRL